MHTKPRLASIVLLGLAPAPAYAHGIPVWMFVAAASPLPVLILIAVYGWLAGSLRAALIHAFLLAVWVAWFWLASNVNEVTLLGISTDYVIWSALVLYTLHALLILILVPLHAFKRLRLRRSRRSHE